MDLEKIEDRQTWNTMKTPKVMEKILDLYETSKWHDCVFKLWNSDGTGEQLVFAHTLVLASSSPVFEALCFGPLAKDSPIEVPDIDPLAFKMMLKFLYTDCIEFTSVEMACNVLYASKKYLIYSLAALAISYISDFINETNCLQVYSFASFIQEEKLMKECWKYLCSHLDDVVKNFSYESPLPIDLVKNLVNEEALNGDEIHLYNICLIWAETECVNRDLEKNSKNLRKVLIEADLLNKIRWLTLTLEEFEEGPMKSGILTNEEVTFISKAIKFINSVCRDCGKNNNLGVENGWKGALLKNLKGSDIDILENIICESKLFPHSVSSNIKMREKIQLKKFYCHRFVEREVRPILSFPNGLKINTHVVTNKSVRLTAIFLNSRILPIPQLNSYPHSMPIVGEYNENIFVSICDSSNKILFSMSFYKKVKYGTVIKIALDNPVILERSNKYKIQIDLLDSPENYVFGVRNSITKFPSGLSVTFTEQASIGENGKFVETNELSIVSGLELCL